MIVLVLLASILIGGITVLQYKKEAQTNHKERLERKEEAIREHIKFVVESTTYEVREETVYLILNQDDKIHEISQVHNMPINVYSLDGDLILKSNQSFFPDTTDLRLDDKVLEQLQSSSQKRVIRQTIKNDKRFKFFVRPEHRPKGANSCRNFGFQLSEGFYIQWFDQTRLIL